MKKETIFTIILLAVGIAALGIASVLMTTYTRPNCVVVDNYDNLVLIEDESGNLWEIENEEYPKGQRLTITFDNNGTDDTIADDKIVDIKEE